MKKEDLKEAITKLKYLVSMNYDKACVKLKLNEDDEGEKFNRIWNLGYKSALEMIEGLIDME